MAVEIGVSAGFVTVAPTDNPTGSLITVDGIANSQKDTSPSNVIKIIEIGWYCDGATQAANFEVGIYSHNAGADEPNTLLAGVDRTNAKGTDLGWKRVTGLNIEITGDTIYWIAFQLDDTATSTKGNSSSVAGQKKSYWSNQTTLQTNWTGDFTTADTVLAIYAVVEEAAEPEAGQDGPYVY